MPWDLKKIRTCKMQSKNKNQQPVGSAAFPDFLRFQTLIKRAGSAASRKTNIQGSALVCLLAAPCRPGALLDLVFLEAALAGTLIMA